MNSLKKFLLLVFFCSILSVSESKEISEALASITVNTASAQITNEAIVATKKALIDVMGISFAGYNSSGMEGIRNHIKFWGGNPQASLWIDGSRVSVPDAAFVNSTLTHALDLDDVHLPSHTHLTAVVIPAALAVGEFQKSTGKEVLEAIILGIEVAGRLGREYDSRVEHIGWLPTTIIGGFGATAAACRLMGLSKEETMNAFGIFYAHASGNRQALYDRTLTKRIQPAIACRAGVVAAFLAKQGITGPSNIFLSPTGLFSIYGANKKPYPTADEILIEKDFFEVEKLSYKKYASCGGGHPVILAAIELSEKYDIKLDNIEKIELFIIQGRMFATPWIESENPQVLAQFCSPYQVVTAIKNRKQGANEIDVKVIRADKEVSSMAKKVIMKKIAKFEPGNGNQALKIYLKNGKVLKNSKTVNDILGIDKMTYNDVKAKYFDNVKYSGLLTPRKSKEIVRAIEHLEEETQIMNLINLL
jgi:2-methylcitrate dehydratase PrpD